jgi:hypothetical protein
LASWRHLEAWWAGGLTQQVYCREHSVSLKTVAHYRDLIGREGKAQAAATFIPVCEAGGGGEEIAGKRRAAIPTSHLQRQLFSAALRSSGGFREDFGGCLNVGSGFPVPTIVADANDGGVEPTTRCAPQKRLKSVDEFSCATQIVADETSAMQRICSARCAPRQSACAVSRAE